MDRESLVEDLERIERGLERVEQYIRIQKRLIEDFADAGRERLLGEAKLLLGRFEEVRETDLARRERLRNLLEGA